MTGCVTKMPPTTKYKNNFDPDEPFCLERLCRRNDYSVQKHQRPYCTLTEPPCLYRDTTIDDKVGLYRCMNIANMIN